mgnify:CR=1 FL=1
MVNGENNGEIIHNDEKSQETFFQMDMCQRTCFFK